MTNSTPTNPLDPKDFYTQNVIWVSESAQLLETKDTYNLHRDIALRMFEGQSAQQALLLKKEWSRADREEWKHLHHNQQVLVPAFRRSTIVLNNCSTPETKTETLHIAACRLASFLLGMVAQSTLFPAEAEMRSLFGARHDATLPGGLSQVHRSLALTILRDHAELFGPCPAWVEMVVVYPKHMSAATAIKERNVRNNNLKKMALRNKIIDLGKLTADEEQLLMRFL